MRKYLVLPLAASLVAAAPAPSFDPARVSADIRTLASDAYEGRGPGTPGETKTVAYVTSQMQAAGLEPGGTPGSDGKRGWTQDVPLLRAEIAGTPQASIDKAGKPRAIVQGTDIAIRAPMTGAKRVDIANAPLVFVGYGVKAPERNWDDFKGVDLRGKVMVVLVNDPDFETGTNDGQGGDFGGKAMTYYGRWTYKYEEAARQGAAGVLVVHETGPAAYGWATVKNSNTNVQFDIVRKDPAKSHAPMEGWIQRDLAVELFKASGLDFDAAKARAQTRGFKPVTLKPRFTAHYAANVGVIHSKNVLGRLSGKTHPDETVIYSAHWDHLGVGLADAKRDRIYNGALDNASGTAALLELARAFGHAPRTDRSIVFLAVTAEEKGLLGSEYYAANPVYPLGKTVGMLNMDGPFGFGQARDFTISGSAKLGLLDDLIAEGRTRGLAYTPDPKPQTGSFYRSDHFPLAKVGVPAVSFGNGQDLVKGGKPAGEAAYKAYVKDRYHQPADQWGPDLDLSAVPTVLDLLYGTGRDLADSRDWPQWSADSEFRAARDASAAERR